MKQFPKLDLESRTLIASLLYKLAIRVMKAAKRAIDPARTTLALNHSNNNGVKRLISELTPHPSLKTHKAPSVQKAVATRTVFPAKGDGIRLDLVFGPLYLLESKGDLAAFGKSTVLGEGPPKGLIPLDRLQEALPRIFGGHASSVRLLTSDVRDLSDRPFRIEHGYDSDSGKKAWKIVHNSGPNDGDVVFYENPNVAGQEAADSDPYQPAVFFSAEKASLVLNQLTRGVSLGSRNFPKFKEYTVFLKYSSVFLKEEDSALYSSFDRLLAEADAEAASRVELSEKERKQLITRAVSWIQERDVSPETLLSTLRVKDPALAERYEQVMDEVKKILSSSSAAKAKPLGFKEFA